VALADVFSTALSGRSKERPELAEATLPLEARLAAVPCRGGEGFLRRLFEPLGYTVTAEPQPLDETRPGWGSSPYYTVTLAATCRLKDLLSHLYVLVPVLDREKHYWVGEAEVEKLLRHGETWLGKHPEREQIARLYLRRRHSLVREALDRLEQAEVAEPEAEEAAHDAEEAAVERRISLNEQRLQAVTEALKQSGAARVLDLGCGEGRLIQALLKERQFTEITGLDVSWRALEIARERLRLDRAPAAAPGGAPERVTLLHGALTYRDRRLEGYDAAAVVEVIEHLDTPRLAAFERVLFEDARPGTVVVTTPNAEYNVRWESLPAGHFRHKDHRFEWTRAQFREWAGRVADRWGYAVEFRPVGPEDDEVGPPTQMAVFGRDDLAG
jgi:3' terminal RNA ribose 2'-O-methyltransferase Hen1